MVPEDRGWYLVDEEVALLHGALNTTRLTMYHNILPILDRKVSSIHIIPNLQKKLRTYIDRAANAVVSNMSKANEAELIDDLLAYLLLHRAYMTRAYPDLWGETDGE
tara:strand:- start:6919 stop:7239 length:321 start_codon:yes stop_codon:yes gene_type:complete